MALRVFRNRAIQNPINVLLGRCSSSEASLRFSTDVVGSSSSTQQQQQHLDQKMKMNTYFVETFMYFSSMHLVSTAAQSTTITEASQS